MKPKTDRRSRQGAESRQRIMDATLELAHELGYTATSIAKVSARSGLPPSSVYWHFESKDDLFAAVIDDSFDQWLRSMPRWDPPTGGHELHSLVEQRIRGAVDSIANNPDFWRLGLMLALENHPVEPTARQRFVDIRARVLDNLTEFWERVLPLRDPSGGRPPRSRLYAQFTLATTDGLFIAAQAEGAANLAHLAELLAAALTGLALGDGAPRPARHARW